MAFAITINGTVNPTFYELNGVQQLSGNRLSELESNLIDGEYLISLATGEVHSLPNLNLVALFKFEVGDDMEYDFIDDEDDDFKF